MIVGLEREFFLVDHITGVIVHRVPTALPHDAAGSLVELRTPPVEHTRLPEVYITAFRLLHKDSCAHGMAPVLQNKVVYDTPHFFRGDYETAGTHLHFNHEVAREPMIAQLNARFESVIKASGRLECRTSPDIWRPKPYGWEWRMLPANVRVDHIADILGHIERAMNDHLTRAA